MNIFEGGRRTVKILSWIWVGVIVAPIMFVWGVTGLTEAGYWAMGIAIVWLPMFWGSTYAMGYIMRGFMGVPKGKDE